jgi:hypothetical protein
MQPKKSKKEERRTPKHCKPKRNGKTMCFDDFWKAYPLKIAKFAARTAFDRALRKDSEEHIIDGEKRYVQWLKGPGWRPRPKHPTTWLNQGCWMDELKDDAYGRQTTSVLGVFDRLEQALAGADDHEVRAPDIQRLPKG